MGEAWEQGVVTRDSTILTAVIGITVRSWGHRRIFGVVAEQCRVNLVKRITLCYYRLLF